MVFLHSDYIFSELILPGHLKTGWEMINFLILIEPFVDVRFATLVHPKYVPVMALGMSETCSFKY